MGNFIDNQWNIISKAPDSVAPIDFSKYEHIPQEKLAALKAEYEAQLASVKSPSYTYLPWLFKHGEELVNLVEKAAVKHEVRRREAYQEIACFQRHARVMHKYSAAMHLQMIHGFPVQMMKEATKNMHMYSKLVKRLAYIDLHTAFEAILNGDGFETSHPLPNKVGYVDFPMEQQKLLAEAQKDHLAGEEWVVNFITSEENQSQSEALLEEHKKEVATAIDEIPFLQRVLDQKEVTRSEGSELKPYERALPYSPA
jgi:hypothetical protein